MFLTKNSDYIITINLKSIIFILTLSFSFFSFSSSGEVLASPQNYVVPQINSGIMFEPNNNNLYIFGNLTKGEFINIVNGSSKQIVGNITNPEQDPDFQIAALNIIVDNIKKDLLYASYTQDYGEGNDNVVVINTTTNKIIDYRF